MMTSPIAGNRLTLHQWTLISIPTSWMSPQILTHARIIWLLSSGILKFGADRGTGGYWSWVIDGASERELPNPSCWAPGTALPSSRSLFSYSIPWATQGSFLDSINQSWSPLRANKGQAEDNPGICIVTAFGRRSTAFVIVSKYSWLAPRMFKTNSFNLYNSLNKWMQHF